jgi:ankyrin repeat protein
MKMMKLFEAFPGADFSLHGANGRTPLHTAVIAKNLPLVARMVKQSTCQIDAVDSGGATPLLLAVRVRSVELMWQLIQHGARYVDEEECGRAPIHECATRNFAEGVYLLHSLGVDVSSAVRTSGSTALHMCAVSEWSLSL